MTYRRVLPRDLFNEADLLKCYGRLWILIDHGRGSHGAGFVEEDVDRFDIQQDDSSGALTVANVTFTIQGRPWRLTRPLNSRQPWPLYAEADDEVVSVFTKDGDLSDEFEALIWRDCRTT